MTEVVVTWAALTAPADGSADPPGPDAGFLPEHVRAALDADIDAATRARLARMRRAADRDRGLAAHALLRRTLGTRLGLRPAEIPLLRTCVSCGSTDHGKPHLADAGLEFTLTHAGRVVALAVAPAGTPVGIDVEAFRPVEWPAMRRRVFADEEWARTEAAPDPDRARFAAWSRKEAAVKVSGHGLTLSLGGVRVAPGEGERWSAELPAAVAPVAGVDLATVDGHVGALAWPEAAAVRRVVVESVRLG